MLLLVIVGNIVDLDGELQVTRGNMLLVVAGSIVDLDGELQVMRDNMLLPVVMGSIVSLNGGVVSDKGQYIASCYRRLLLVAGSIADSDGELQAMRDKTLLPFIAGSVVVLDDELQATRDNTLPHVIMGMNR